MLCDHPIIDVKIILTTTRFCLRLGFTETMKSSKSTFAFPDVGRLDVYMNVIERNTLCACRCPDNSVHLEGVWEFEWSTFWVVGFDHESQFLRCVKFLAVHCAALTFQTNSDWVNLPTSGNANVLFEDFMVSVKPNLKQHLVVGKIILTSIIGWSQNIGHNKTLSHKYKTPQTQLHELKALKAKHVYTSQFVRIILARGPC